MCGIVGAIARRNIVPILTEGLKRLEYRGYDSAGIAVVDRSIRRVRYLEGGAEEGGAGNAGHPWCIAGCAHTRWATHGGVTEPNAHPQVSSDEIAVVHNGIIENHEEQRERLKALERENRELRQANEILRKASAYFAQAELDRRPK